MDYEKKYNEALERMKSWARGEHPECFTEAQKAAEFIFPELKENEDEKIRKALIDYFDDANKVDENPLQSYGIHTDKTIAWLEKQGEQKEYTFKSIPRLMDMIEPTDRTKAYCQKLIDTLAKEGYNIDAKIVENVLKGWNGEDVPMAVMDEQKPVNDTDEDIVEAVKDTSILDMVEPKFKVGDWIVNKFHDICLITDIDLENGYYICESNRFGNTDGDIDLTDKAFHLWTIQDAKDGDVLAWDNSKRIALFKNIYDEDSFNSHGFVGHCTGTFDESSLSYHDIKGVHPATKEQHNFLFQKMHEAGYEWNAEKKEPKKIHVIDEGKAEMDYCFTKMMNGEKVSSAWSEEDDIIFDEVINNLHNYIFKSDNTYSYIDCDKHITWLKSLKQRIGG